jgi:hypothetical protein
MAVVKITNKELYKRLRIYCIRHGKTVIQSIEEMVLETVNKDEASYMQNVK